MCRTNRVARICYSKCVPVCLVVRFFTSIQRLTTSPQKGMVLRPRTKSSGAVLCPDTATKNLFWPQTVKRFWFNFWFKFGVRFWVPFWAPFSRPAIWIILMVPKLVPKTGPKAGPKTGPTVPKQDPKLEPKMNLTIEQNWRPNNFSWWQKKVPMDLSGCRWTLPILRWCSQVLGRKRPY